MNIGINYPLENYGWDFGDPPEEWVPAASLGAWRGETRQTNAQYHRGVPVFMPQAASF
ncbi:MAG: hypothetical protein ACKOB4_06290 [Acidobacteriota bacterium]